MELKKMLGLVKQKKGVAGLNIYLGLIATIFVIGIILMAFQLTSSKLKTAVGSDAVAFAAINDTSTALTTADDFFPIFITIGAVVVLILLIVIIIGAIRSGGLMGDGGA